MRAKSAVLLLLALGCGLVAAIGVTQVINKDVAPPVETGDTASIFVALRDITPGELLTPQLLKLEPWPKAKIPEGSLSTLESVEGCRARTEILQGEPIREKKLLGKGATQQTPTDYIPKGYRVVGVKVDPTPARRSSSRQAPSAPQPPTEPPVTDPSSGDNTLRATPPERIPAPMPGS